MKIEHLINYVHSAPLTRREAMGVAGKAGVGAILGALGLSRIAEAAEAGPHSATGIAAVTDVASSAASRRSALPQVARFAGGGAEEPSDEMFDVEAVEKGAWVPGPYGRDDQRGSLNEVTPSKTAEALALLDPARPVVTYNLGELLFNGFPAFTTAPPRVYEQRLTILGYVPKPGFAGILQSPVPLGPNRISAHEERFATGTYHIATQLDGLNHIGVGEMFYNGFRGPEIGESWGTNALGNEQMGPIVTRGVLLDILGLKQAQGQKDAYFVTPTGRAVLKDDYRITIDDIEAAMARGGISGIRPGDVVLFRTGWTHMVTVDPQRYLAREPGIYLREARYLAAFRPAIIGSDSWALEVLDPAIVQGNFFPVHQLLFMRYGIRIGESIVTEDLARDGVYEFVYVTTPQYAKGATAGNAPPIALANRR